MKEINIHDRALIEEVSDLLKITDETLEIKDKYYISTDILLVYIDELLRYSAEQQEKIEHLQSMMNEDQFDRYYERGGFPL